MLTLGRFLEGLKRVEGIKDNLVKILILPKSKVTNVYYTAKSGRSVKLAFDGKDTASLGEHKLFKALVKGKTNTNNNIGKFYETNKKQELVVTHITRPGGASVNFKETVISHGADKKPTQITRNGSAVFNKGGMSI